MGCVELWARIRPCGPTAPMPDIGVAERVHEGRPTTGPAAMSTESRPPQCSEAPCHRMDYATVACNNIMTRIAVVFLRCYNNVSINVFR